MNSTRETDPSASSALPEATLPRIVFVLVGTTHTGNLGAAARAMKTMGFTELRLVNACSHRSEEAMARASGANHVLSEAATFTSLDDAVADCHAVIGTSARARNIAVPLLSCREAAEHVRDLQSAAKADEPELVVAMVFGQERSGLSNDDLDRCTRHLRIPCNPEFSSLNLGSAVQVVAYELSRVLGTVPQTEPQPMPGKWKPAGLTEGEGSALADDEVERDARPVSSDDMERLFAHLDKVMIDSGFLNPDMPRYLRRRMRRYFSQNRPNDNEVAILRGLLSAIEKYLPSSEQR